MALGVRLGRARPRQPTPMKFFRPLQPGQGLASLHRLALLLLALLAAVALLQADRLGRQADQEQLGARDSAGLVHGLTRLVDDGRGLEALHLAQDSAVPQRALEAELLRQRQRLQARLKAASTGRSVQEQACLDAVAIRLGAYWQVQDQLLQASRLALHNASLVPQAQALLNGSSQDSYRAVIDALDTWWRQHEAELAASPLQSRSQALLCLRLALLAVVLLLLGLLLGLAQQARAGRRQGQPTTLKSDAPAPDDHAAQAPARRAAQRAQDKALRAQVLALNATVQAARGGGRRADLDALASQAQALALRCAAAADQDGGSDSRLDPPSLPFMADVDADTAPQADAAKPPRPRAKS